MTSSTFTRRPNETRVSTGLELLAQTLEAAIGTGGRRRQESLTGTALAHMFAGLPSPYTPEALSRRLAEHGIAMSPSSVATALDIGDLLISPAERAMRAAQDSGARGTRRKRRRSNDSQPVREPARE